MISAIGTAQAYKTVEIRSQVNGQIERVLFKQGDFLKAGQIIFQLDKRPFKAALDQAIGNLAKDKANAADQRAQADRDNALLKAGVIAVQVAEQQEATAQAAQAAVQADAAAVETAKVNLSYTDIKAPIDGRAGAILVNLGNVVQANSTNPLTVINQISPIYVQFSIPEAQLPAVQKRKSGTLTVTAFPPSQTTGPQGKLTFVNNAVDPTTGTIQLMATFPNKDHVLWPGQFLNVQLELGVQPNAIVVPADAVQTSQQGNYVFVVQQNGTALMQPVTSSRNYRGLAVIQSGVQPGQKVIVNGQIRVIPNNPVNVVKTIPTEPGPIQPAAQPEQTQTAQNQSGTAGGGPQ
ncbi:MAG TPA: efflux RND transporter periplasmic adaptor subunit [Terriglobales bacterium]|nr:efflux RND transporter periplasmic adaptor subunit [Terriglobales bacterium]